MFFNISYFLLNLAYIIYTNFLIYKFFFSFFFSNNLLQTFTNLLAYSYAPVTPPSSLQQNVQFGYSTEQQMQQTQSYAHAQYMSQTQVQRTQEISSTNISSQQQVQQQQFAATNLNYQQQQQLQQQQLQQQQQYTAATNLNLQQQQQQLTSQPFVFSDGVATTTSNMAYRAVQENDVDTGASKSLKPNFVKIPGDKEVTEGKMVRFDLRVSGRPFPDVSWYLNGTQVVDDLTHKLLVNEGGVHALMITSTSRTDAGTYTCVARNKSGDATFTVNLHVIGKFLFLISFILISNVCDIT